MKKLQVTAFALACGLTWGLFLFMVTLLAKWAGWGMAFVEVVGDVYKGVEPTCNGAFLGLLWAFTDGFIAGLIFVLLYNFFAKNLSNISKF